MTELADNPETRLIVYGSLAPGEANAFLLESLDGTWHRCVIQGQMGSWYGFKSFRHDPEGPAYPAWLLESPELPPILPELDAFEGQAYERVLIPVQVKGRRVLAQIYQGRHPEEE